MRYTILLIAYVLKLDQLLSRTTAGHLISRARGRDVYAASPLPSSRLASGELVPLFTE